MITAIEYRNGRYYIDETDVVIPCQIKRECQNDATTAVGKTLSCESCKSEKE